MFALFEIIKDVIGIYRQQYISKENFSTRKTGAIALYYSAQEFLI